MLLHQPSGQVGYGQVTDLELAAAEIQRMREILDGILAEHTGQPIERIHTDTDRDFVMEADEALEYGIIDKVISSREAVDRTGPDPLTRAGSVRFVGSGPRFVTVDVARLSGSDRPTCDTVGPARHGAATTRRGDRQVAKFGDTGELLKCSFCGKSQKQVKKLIAGPGVYICDECIDLCNEIIEEELTETAEL